MFLWIKISGLSYYNSLFFGAVIAAPIFLSPLMA